MLLRSLQEAAITRYVAEHQEAAIQPVAVAPAAPEVTEDHVINMVMNADSAPDRGPGQDGHRRLHVSKLVDLCPRQFFLTRTHDIDAPTSITSGLHITFAQGRAIEDHVVSQVISTVSPAGLWGVWKCRCGHIRREGVFSNLITCARCNTQPTRYGQPTLVYEPWQVVGRPDLTLIINGTHLFPVEIKSMARRQWEQLREPRGDHVVQALLYHWLMGERNQPTVPYISLVYVAKEFIYGNPYKEFHVDVRTERSQTMLSAALDNARETAEALRTGVIPPRTVCLDSNCTRAKECPVATLCFNLE